MTSMDGRKVDIDKAIDCRRDGKKVDIKKALQIWDDYRREHDVSDRSGQVVGIDPDTGRIWFGKTVRDVSRQLDAEPVRPVLFLVRIGSEPFLYRKRGHR